MAQMKAGRFLEWFAFSAKVRFYALLYTSYGRKILTFYIAWRHSEPPIVSERNDDNAHEGVSHRWLISNPRVSVPLIL
jgi:hypothetical protein